MTVWAAPGECGNAARISAGSSAIEIRRTPVDARRKGVQRVEPMECKLRRQRISPGRSRVPAPYIGRVAAELAPTRGRFLGKVNDKAESTPPQSLAERDRH
jgi:hypothetical protein